jgi:hypothetical protein
MPFEETGYGIDPEDGSSTIERAEKKRSAMSPETEELNRHFAKVWNEMLARRDGHAEQCQWRAEDGWLIVYTTTRVQDGPHDGKFVTLAYKPVGPGARTKPREWRCVYKRAFSTRKAAKARAVKLYYDHSPKKAAKHGVVV